MEYHDCSYDSRDSHGGLVSITTYRNEPKCMNNSNFKILKKSFWVGGLRTGSARSSETQGFLFVLSCACLFIDVGHVLQVRLSHQLTHHFFCGQEHCFASFNPLLHRLFLDHDIIFYF